jgi:hypothetical protein
MATMSVGRVTHSATTARPETKTFKNKLSSVVAPWRSGHEFDRWEIDRENITANRCNVQLRRRIGKILKTGRHRFLRTTESGSQSPAYWSRPR